MELLFDDSWALMTARLWMMLTSKLPIGFSWFDMVEGREEEMEDESLVRQFRPITHVGWIDVVVFL